ncbi:hypothetical protein F3Y22_tig00111206pilonHSYRG00154 [Hibiscus syriacus]|uniref:RRM domain-containing protein n=1 Tax=Hibiscus syriacus TaxID=106335 RepID=A0A6A2YW04_HIBSY|nr:hypothetical protein F3Y22_tig00111206pilonHSYRG00154 [Hibiscus syriacus]
MVVSITEDGTVLGRSQAECNHVERRLKMVVADGENEGDKDAKDKVVTFFIDNLPMELHWKGLWQVFGRQGRVLNVYIASKKSRRGTRFAFVRIDSMPEAGRMIGNLDEKIINNCRISMSLAKNRRLASEGKKASSKKNRPQVFLPVDSSSEKLKSQRKERENEIIQKMAMEDEKAFNDASIGNEPVEENNDEGVSKEVGGIDLEQIELWNELCILRSMDPNVWIVAGDFNVVRSRSERRRGMGSIVGCKEFNEVIANCKLVDLTMRDKKFTWYGPANRSCSLDRFLLDEKWFFGGGNFEQFGLKWIVSDHASLMLVSDNVDWGPKPFKIFNGLLNKTD